MWVREHLTDAENPLYDSRDNCNAIVESGSNTLIQGGGESVIPGSVTSIGSSAFADSTVENIKIPEGVEVIEDQAFQSCYWLRLAFIPESVGHIGENVFDHLSAIYGIKGSYAQEYALEHNIPFYEELTWPGGTWSLSDDGTLTISGKGVISLKRLEPWLYLKFNTLVIIAGV